MKQTINGHYDSDTVTNVCNHTFLDGGISFYLDDFIRLSLGH